MSKVGEWLQDHLGIPQVHISMGTVENALPEVAVILAKAKTDVETWIQTGAADLTGAQGDALVTAVLADAKNIPILNTFTAAQAEAVLGLVVPKYTALLIDKVDSVFDLATEAETTTPTQSTTATVTTTTVPVASEGGDSSVDLDNSGAILS